MKELGMWQGMKGVWWTQDLGWDDDLDFFERAPETRIEPSAQVPYNPHLIVHPRVGGFSEPVQRKILSDASDPRKGERGTT